MAWPETPCLHDPDSCQTDSYNTPLFRNSFILVSFIILCALWRTGGPPGLFTILNTRDTRSIHPLKSSPNVIRWLSFFRVSFHIPFSKPVVGGSTEMWSSAPRCYGPLSADLICWHDPFTDGNAPFFSEFFFVLIIFFYFFCALRWRRGTRRLFTTLSTKEGWNVQ